jgi:RNA polymerase sigma-70 factor (ECF subfamily)
LGETELIDRAKGGDREAFGALYEPVERPLAEFLYRLTASRQDAEDIAQETAIRALEEIERFGGASSFRTWIFRFAAQAGLTYMQARPPWDPDAQLWAGQRLGDQTSDRNWLQKLHGSRLHTTFDIREHIDFCFTCMARTLYPHEAAALLLVEVHGFTSEEAAEVLETSADAIRFRVDQARGALTEHFESRCTLINQAGTCSHCSGFHTWLYGDRKLTEQALFQIELQPHPTAGERAATLDQRLRIVRAANPLLGEGAKFHESLMTFLREVSHY